MIVVVYAEGVSHGLFCYIKRLPKSPSHSRRSSSHHVIFSWSLIMKYFPTCSQNDFRVKTNLSNLSSMLHMSWVGVGVDVEWYISHMKWASDVLTRLIVYTTKCNKTLLFCRRCFFFNSGIASAINEQASPVGMQQSKAFENVLAATSSDLLLDAVFTRWL